MHLLTGFFKSVLIKMFMYINKFQNLEAIFFFHTNWPGRVHFSGCHGAVLVSLSHCFLDVVQITDHDLL